MTAPEPSQDADEGPVGPFDFEEKPRSYRELLVAFALIAVGFAFDATLGSATAHLPGWILAAVVIVGADALFVASARSTRSLAVTADAVWVGEETVPRADITGVVVGVAADAGPDTPVLGWPGGRPGRLKGVTMRLANGMDVVVPTRRGADLAAVLGVGSKRPRVQAEVRPADEDERPLLAEIDRRAEILFRLAEYDLPEIEFRTEALDDALAVFVIADPPVGFVWLDEVDGLAHVEEIAVVPGVMRTGVGTRLLEHACDWARDAGYAAITLTTYADVPWNGPFYASRGFVESSALTPGLVAAREREAALGLDAVARRIVMRRELSRPRVAPGPG